VVVLPRSLVPRLRSRLAHARALWVLDRAEDRGGVAMLARFQNSFEGS
jgi:hypothetical protein